MSSVSSGSSVIKNGSTESFNEDTPKSFKTNGNFKTDAQSTNTSQIRDSLQPQHAFQTNGVASSPPRSPSNDDEQKICFICEDKATGLHYGIITCEG